MEYQFDINHIIGLKFVEARPSRYEWAEARPYSSSWFGLCKTLALPAGWIDPSCWSERRYTEDELKEYDYIFINGKPYNRPHVTVYLSHEYQVTNQFDSDSDALNWIDVLKQKTGKEFEIIKY